MALLEEVGTGGMGGGGDGDVKLNPKIELGSICPRQNSAVRSVTSEGRWDIEAVVVGVLEGDDGFGVSFAESAVVTTEETLVTNPGNFNSDSSTSPSSFSARCFFFLAAKSLSDNLTFLSPAAPLLFAVETVAEEVGGGVGDLARELEDVEGEVG